MVYGQKKDYFSFIEPAFHRVRVALNDFQFPNRLIGKSGTIAKPPKSPDMMSHKYLRLGISKHFRIWRKYATLRERTAAELDPFDAGNNV